MMKEFFIPKTNQCIAKKKKAYYEKNKELILNLRKAYCKKNKESISKKSKIYYVKNKEKIAARDKAYRKNNKVKIAKTKSLYYKKNKVSIAKKNKIYREAHKDLIIKNSKKYRENNKEAISIKKSIDYRLNKERLSKKAKEYRKNNKDIIREQKMQKVLYSSKSFEKFTRLYKTQQTSDGYGQVQCKYCNDWYTPNRRELKDKLNSDIILETGEMIDSTKCNIYCSEKCKEACPTFNKTAQQLINESKVANGEMDPEWYSSVEYKTWRDVVLELDNYKCAWCEEPATIVHHILPQKTHPEFSLDPQNGLSCCIDCHNKYGHRDKECTTGALAQLICAKKVKID